MAISIPIITTYNSTGIDKAAKDISKAEGGWAKAGAGIKAATLPAAAAIAGLGVATFGFIKAGEDAATANANLAQSFKSMGYEENAQAAKDYAEALSGTIGVDDEVIKNAQAKLATFSQIARSTDTMGRSTALAADLSAKGFGSMDSAAVLLGKALENPTKGVSALSRVGVELSDSQKAQVKALQETGDMAGAQEVIFKALETQVGGTAEATANDTDKLAVGFSNVGSAIGTALLPVLNAVLPYLLQFAAWAQENTGAIVAIGAVIGGLATFILIAAGAMKVWSIITSIVSAANLILGTSFTLALGPVLLIIAAIVAVIAIGVLLYKNWDKITAFLAKAWDTVKAKTSEVWNSVKTKLGEAWQSIKTAVSNGVTNVVNFIKEMPGKILAAIGNFASLLFDKGVALITGLAKGYISIWTTVLSFFGGIGGKILGAIGNVGRLLFDKGRQLIQGMIDGIKSAIGGIGNILGRFNPFGFSAGASGYSGTGISTYGTRAHPGRTAAPVVVNIYESRDARYTAALVKRALEGYDVSEGRSIGAPLARAW